MPSPGAVVATSGDGSTSLDTGQHLGIHHPGERHRGRDRSARLAEDDARKGRLAVLLSDAAHAIGSADDEAYARWTFFLAKSDALEACRSVRTFRHDACQGRVQAPCSCNVRGCPSCDHRRAAELVRKYEETARDAIRPALWTFTLADAELRGDLAGSIAFLRRAMGRLRERAIFAGGACGLLFPDGTPMHPCHPARRTCPSYCPNRRKRACPDHPAEPHPHVVARRCPPDCPHVDHWCRSQWCRKRPCPHRGVHGHRRLRNCPEFQHAPVRGGIVSLEVTVASDGRWHPHLHVLLDGPWIDWLEMQLAWRALTCTARGCRHGDDDDRCTGAWAVWVTAARPDAVREVLKYAVKPEALEKVTPARYAELLWAIRHQRLVNGFGSFRGVHDRADDEPESDTVVLRGWGFKQWHVPRVCPHCGVETSGDDWSGPFEVSRLAVVDLPSVYARPPTAPRPVQ